MDLDSILGKQRGVISRRQVLDETGDDHLIERMVRRNEWRPIHPGVYVSHTGPPSDRQLRMAAVLYAWPAALAAESALVEDGVRNVVEGEIKVAIDESRRVLAPAGVSVRRLREFDKRVMWNRRPPRIRLTEAALDAASRSWVLRGESGAVALLSDVCQQRLTTPSRLMAELEAHPRLPGRGFLRALLLDVQTGAFSLLEHRYLSKVERAHGLPRGNRQGPFVGDRPGYRDVGYERQGVVIELDGRLGHEFAADQWADLERDLVAATDHLMTARLGWGAVAEPCRLAAMVGRLLRARGWGGQVHTCPDCRGDTGGSSASDAGDLPTIGVLRTRGG